MYSIFFHWLFATPFFPCLITVWPDLISTFSIATAHNEAVTGFGSREHLVHSSIHSVY